MRVISSPQPTPDARIDITLFALTVLFPNVNVICESNLTLLLQDEDVFLMHFQLVSSHLPYESPLNFQSSRMLFPESTE